jgi:hypothetical protein
MARSWRISSRPAAGAVMLSIPGPSNATRNAMSFFESKPTATLES